MTEEMHYKNEIFVEKAAEMFIQLPFYDIIR
jgi:hypothetical protein